MKIFEKKQKFSDRYFQGSLGPQERLWSRTIIFFFVWGKCPMNQTEVPSRGSRIPKMSLHGFLVCPWQPKMWKMWKKWKFQNFSFFKARLAFHHVGPPNIDVLKGSWGFYQILRRQLHIPSRPEQKQSEKGINLGAIAIVLCPHLVKWLMVVAEAGDDGDVLGDLQGQRG